jgi:multicomponent Na+:H+ antiporter subunit B
MNFKKDLRIKHIFLSLLSSALMISIVSLLFNIKNDIHQSVGELFLAINMDTASANAVTSVVTFFRGLDTLGEVTVLFLATTGISLMLSSSKRVHDKIVEQESFILNAGSKLLLSIIVLFGVYIIVHGHLSPGGGFQGGVVIASAFLLLFLANPNMDLKHSILTFGESVSGASYVLVGIIGLFKLNILFGNFLPHPIGQIGELISGGIIPIIYIIVGIKVGSEMTVIIEYFIKREAQNA